MPNTLTTRGGKGDMLKSVYDQDKDDRVDVIEAQISDLDHNAQKIKGVTIDDAAKADQKVLAYDQASHNIKYIPRCPEIVIRAIQHVTITFLTGETSHQVLINEVDMAKTFIISGRNQSASSDTDEAFARVELTDSTHITATRGSTGPVLIINISLVECTAGINSIQRGTIQLGVEAIHDATINEVDTDKTFVSHLGVTSTTTTLTRALVRAFLLDSTTVRAQRDAIYSDMTISYEVVEFL